MTDQSVNYDDVKQYRLDPAREQEVVNTAGECVFIWANREGHPIGVITAYVPVEGKIWMTATRDRVRIKAIARDSRSSVVMSSYDAPSNTSELAILDSQNIDQGPVATARVPLRMPAGFHGSWLPAA